jgi:hypothetical protein
VGRRFAAIAFGAVLLSACGSTTTTVPSVAPTPTSTLTPPPSPTPTDTPSPAPTLNVTPLIPVLGADGTLHLLGEDGTTSASIPAATSLELFSPFGNAFLAGTVTSGQLSALVALQPDGTMQTLQSITDPSKVFTPTGASDGHAFAWLAGTQYSSLCNNGMTSGTLDVEAPGGSPTVIAQLPSGGATSAWTIGGWTGDDVWLVETSGCVAPGGGGTTTAYIARHSGGALTALQPQLGTGCVLTAVAIDGPMLCMTEPKSPSATTWRFVNTTAGVVRNFNVSSLGTLCAGHGSLHDFEGVTLSADSLYMTIDAGCLLGNTRFDQLFIIPTSTGIAQPVATSTYLAADSWLPDDTLLCNDLSNPSGAVAYLVSPQGVVSEFSPGDATWVGSGVDW